MRERQIYPARDAVGSDLYTVLKYYPLWELVDLAPASINQRGILSKVPVSIGFGGSWEMQANHEPRIQTVDPALWGNIERGPRWGISYPIQQGDLCRVEYQGESMSDPVVVAVYRSGGDYGPAWVANQVVGPRDTPYTRLLPADDSGLENRFDLTLPTGAWLRSGGRGSWVLSTSPINQPRAFLSMDSASGAIYLKGANSSGEYTTSIELNPEAEIVRLAAGPEGATSHVELNGGNLTLRAMKDLEIFAQNLKVDLAPQGAAGVGAALSPIQDLAPGTSDAETLSLASEAAGNLVTQGFTGPYAAAELFNNPALDGALRNRVEGLALELNPVAAAIAGFTQNMSDGDMAQQLIRTIGAKALGGELGQVLDRLDLGKLAGALNLDSWDLDDLDINGILDRGLDLGELLSGELEDRANLRSCCQWVGEQIMGGGRPAEVRDRLREELGDFGGGLLDQLGDIPGLPTLPDAAQRLGRYILSGNDSLGGPAQLFTELEKQKLVLAAGGSRVRRLANQVERMMTQAEIPDLAAAAGMGSINDLLHLPSELRGAIARLPKDLIPQLPDYFAGIGALGSGDPSAAVEAVFDRMPDELRAAAQQLGGQIFGELPDLGDDTLAGILADPQAALDGLSGLFSGAQGSLLIGKVDVNSIINTQLAKPLPKLPAELQPFAEALRDVVTSADPISRVSEYGLLKLRSEWNGQTD